MFDERQRVLTENEVKSTIDDHENGSKNDKKEPKDEPDSEFFRLRPGEHVRVNVDDAMSFFFTQRKEEKWFPSLLALGIEFSHSLGNVSIVVIFLLFGRKLGVTSHKGLLIINKTGFTTNRCGYC